MEAIILIGLQASGKSTFCRERFGDSHVRINLDMLRTRHREQLLLDACLNGNQPFVIDNTNPTREDRQRYISQAKPRNFRVVGYYFASQIEECKRRNEQRAEPKVVPLPGLLGTYGRLELPTWDEGFDELHYVAIDNKNNFRIEKWVDEV